MLLRSVDKERLCQQGCTFPGFTHGPDLIDVGDRERELTVIDLLVAACTLLAQENGFPEPAFRSGSR